MADKIIKRILNIGGLNLYTSPFLKKDGELIKSVNMDPYPYGAMSKRSGYETYLGTADGSTPVSLFSWTKNDNTTLFTYRASGSALYHSIQGTGAWTLSGNGTINPGVNVGYAILGDTLIAGEATGSTRHSTNGTSFTNTTAAPVGQFFAPYQNRVYIGGTQSTLFYSTTGDATNWSSSGTSDSSSLAIPGAGKINGLFVQGDRLVISKTSGLMFRWDGFSLADISTTLGPTSPHSIDQTEGFYMFLNRQGVFGYGGLRPEVISNPIQPQIYNNSGSAVAGTVFTTAPGAIHRYKYLLSVGDTTDDFTQETINNCIFVYDYQKNQWSNYSLAAKPTSWHSFVNNAKGQQLIFGASGGQCYTLGGTALTDDTSAISTRLEFVLDMDNPEREKEFRRMWGFFNPGCQASVQVATGDSYRRTALNWVEVGDVTSGVMQLTFPQGSRGRLLYVRISESSKTAPFVFYGFCIDADLVPIP